MAGPTSAQLTGRAQQNAEAAGVARFTAWAFAVIAIIGALVLLEASDRGAASSLAALGWVCTFGGVVAAFALLATLLSGQSLVLRTLAEDRKGYGSGAGASGELDPGKSTRHG